MKYDFTNAGIREQVDFPEELIENTYLPLLRHLTELQMEKQERILVFLAAPPGAGKSTLASFLKELSVNVPGLTEVTPVSMDGFHRYQSYLKSHTIMRDGAEIQLVKIKGAPETFDLPLLTERIRRLKSEMAVSWPAYDRRLHDPVENAVSVDGKIVLLEGNYLLLDEDGWRDLKQYADYTISLSLPEEVLRERLVKRKISTGVSREDSEKFVDFSDMYNVRTCLNKSLKADLDIKTEI